jgi:DNA-binding NtrC family response regulator
VSTPTHSLQESAIELARTLGPRRLGFVVLWSRDEPERIGEQCLMPRGLGEQAILGRGADENGLTWLRVQPGRTVDTGPLSSAHISRRQLTISVRGPRLLEIENLGRSPLIHDGRRVETALVCPGDLVELHARLLLMCVERSDELELSAHEDPLPLHEFGRADEFGFVGESPAAWAMRAELHFIGPRDAHVLVHGASGTGKELVANAIHSCSARRDRTLVSRNAATIPETLVDAELFGNVKGYPQAGMPARPGLIGEAHGSTLFLDEFAELPESSQAHLLRVLDAGEYMQLGDSRSRKGDFRLVAATNRPTSAIKHDVLARLRLRLELPGLDARREDIPLLVRHLLRGIARREPDIARRLFPDGNPEAEPRVSVTLVERLVRHPYTMHVRELETLLWQAMTRSRGDVLEFDASDDDEQPEQPDTLEPNDALGTSTAGSGIDPLSIPPEQIQACLDANDGRQEPTWRALGLTSRYVLTRLVKRHNLRVRGRS